MDSINQAMLILIMIMPGYLCCSIKEMWTSHREKTNFEKLWNSLIYSVFLWLPFWIYLLHDLPEKIDTISIIFKLFFPVLILMPILILIIAKLVSWCEQKEYLFKIGKRLNFSVKISHGIPLLELLVNRPNPISSIEVETNDGCVYRGNRKKDNNWEIIWGSHPHSGDVSFVCHYFKDRNGNEHKYLDDKLEVDGYSKRIYIPKESIKTIKYLMKYID